MLIWLACGVSAANFGSYGVTLNPIPMTGAGFITGEDDLPGSRTPSQKVQCTIDATAGIQFVGMEKPEILTFEIYDLSGACVAVFGDEDSFLDFLFAQSREYQIRLVTASWAYVGYIGV